MPKLPFTLFDFEKINFFDVKYKVVEAAAGAAITPTTIYTVPEHKLVLLLNLQVKAVKTTGTALIIAILRKTIDVAVDTEQALISETAGTDYFCWPSGKTTGSHVLGQHLCFLFAGDIIRISHAGTAAETIKDTISWLMIEYNDPRYEK